MPELSNLSNSRIRSDIRAIIKLMIGDRDRWNEQVQPLKMSDMPIGMESEGYTFEALEYCSIQGLDPSAETIIRLLEVNQRVSEPQQFIQTIIQENSGDTAGIRTLSNFVGFWATEQKFKTVSEKISQIALAPTMDYADKWESTYSLVMSVSPLEDFMYDEISEKEFIAIAANRNEEIWKLREAGLDIGPQFPFEAMNAYFSALHWGEVSLLVGKTGSGKTSHAQVLGENVAWKQKLHCDVAHFSLETPLDVLSTRQFCRHNNLLFSRVAEGYLRLKSDKWKPTWDAWAKRVTEKTNESGYIRYWHSPDASVNDICSAMIRTSETSRALNHSIIYIIDHLHSINWQKTHARMGEFEAMRAIHLQLAAVANKLSTRIKNHLFVFAQEGDDRGNVFGGKMPAKRSQYVFSISRERFGQPDNDGRYPRAPEGQMIEYNASQLNEQQKKSPFLRQSKKDPTKYVLLDAEGNERWWFRKGDEYSHRGAMDVTKGNDNALGSVRTLYEPAMSRIMQDPDQINEMRKDNLLPPVGVR